MLRFANTTKGRKAPSFLSFSLREKVARSAG